MFKPANQPIYVLALKGGTTMRFILTLVTLALITWTATSQADPAGSIACSPLPAGATAGYRAHLDSGGYGFCVVTACQSPLELSSAHCVAPPSAKWFSLDRSIQSGDYTLAVYAQLNRPPSGPQVYNISTASSTATSSDFDLLTTQAVFDNYSYSNPIFLKIKRTAGDNPTRTIALRLSSASTGTGTIGSPDTLTFTISAQSTQPIQMSVSDETVTAGDIAHIAVTLSEPHSIYFPTFITARYFSGDRSAVLVGQVDGSIPAGQTSSILNLPTFDRSISSNVTVQFSMRTSADILITKSLSLITILSKAPTCLPGMHVEGFSCVSDTYIPTLSSYLPSPGAVAAVCSGSEIATRTITSCLDSNTNQVVLNAFCTDLIPSITRLSPAGQQTCAIANGSGAQSCSQGSSTPTTCLATSCDTGHHIESGICAINTYVPTYSAYSPSSNPLLACQGTSVASRSVSGCKQNWDNADVDLSFCANMDQSPSITYQSPAGNQSCSIANGIGTQSCALGSSVPSACVAASCATNFHASSGSCVADTYTPSFSAYAANTVTAVCSGSQTASRSITACTRDNDGAAMALSLCSDPSPTASYQSPGGSQACSIANGAGSQTCSVGGTSWSTCALNTCNANFHQVGSSCVADSRACSIANGAGSQTWDANLSAFGACQVVSCITDFHQASNSCVADTYTPSFSSYAANTVTAVCSGSQTAARSITACTRDNDGATMALSRCSDPSPTTSYQSPSGNQSCSIANGTGSQSCSIGSTSWSSCSVVSCATNFHQSGSSCVSDTYTATYSAYSPNTVTAVCSGTQVAPRSIVSCTRDYDSAAMASSFCSDPSPSTTYQSPAGSQSCSIASGSGTQSCSLGSSSPSTCLVSSCSSGFYASADNQSCVINPSISPTSWSLNSNVTKQFSVSGGTAPYVWTASAGSISASGLYTPSNATGSRTVTVTDAAGHSASASVSVTAMWNLTITQPSLGAISGASSSLLIDGTSVSLSFVGSNMAGNWTGACTTALTSPCSFTMSADKTVGASVSCNSLFHSSSGSCEADTFTASYSAYSPASLAVCGGTTTGTRTIASCVDDQTAQSVATTNCSDPSPTTSIASPAGSQSCTIANGTGTQSCAAGSSTPSTCAVVTCNSNFYASADNHSCVVNPSISPTSWSMNSNVTKTFTVSGGTAPFTWSSSAGSITSAGVFTPANSSTTQTVTVTDAAGHSASASVSITAMWSLTITQPSLGAISGASSSLVADGATVTLSYAGSNTSGNWTGACITALSSSCSFTMSSDKIVGALPTCNQYYHQIGSACAADTFTPTFSAYSANTVNQPCMGQQNASRSITACIDNWNSQSVAVSNCTDPSPNTTYNSPAGTSTTAPGVQPYCATANASVVATYCGVGQISATSTANCFVSSCNGGFKGWANNSWGPTQCVRAHFNITSYNIPSNWITWDTEGNTNGACGGTMFQNSEDNVNWSDYQWNYICPYNSFEYYDDRNQTIGYPPYFMRSHTPANQIFDIWGNGNQDYYTDSWGAFDYCAVYGCGDGGGE
jgi:hypothetical protein